MTNNLRTIIDPSALWRRFARFGWIALLLTILQMSVGIMFFVIHRTFNFGDFMLMLLHALFWSSVGVLLMSGRNHRWAKRISAYLLFFLSISIFLFESFMLRMYGSLYSHNMAVSILATNPAETEQFFSGPLRLMPLLVPVVLLVLIFIGSYLLGRCVRHLRVNTKRLSYEIYAILLLYLLVGLPIMISNYRDHSPNYTAMAPMDRFIVGTLYSLEDNRLSIEQVEQTVQTPVSLHINQPTSKPHTVVLILGESLNRSYLHSYGYPLNTTPHIDQWLATGDLLQFNDVVAPKPNTANAVPEILTLHTVDDEEQHWSTTHTLPTLLSQAGYYTYWLSNHQPKGAYVKPTATIIAETSDSTYFVLEHPTNDNNYDENVLPHLMHRSDLPLSVSDKSFFQLVHLMGSHPQLRSRYPDTFETFKASDIEGSIDEDYKDDMAAYANSVLYNDHIVNCIIEQYADESAIVLYLPDHGLSVYDDPEHPYYLGHSVSAPGLEIPFFVYLSPAMRQECPDLYQNMQRVVDAPYMSDLLSHTILQMLGIGTPYSHPAYELFSGQYDYTRKRLIKDFACSIEMPQREYR